MRLRPSFTSHQTAFLALADLDAVPKVLSRVEIALGGTLSAFELMWPSFYHLMTGGKAPRHSPPVTSDAAAYLIIEAEGGAPEQDQARFSQVLEDLLEDELFCDAAIAQSQADVQRLWGIRNDIAYIISTMSPILPYDISVPAADMADYVAEMSNALTARWPDVKMITFGHVADNNLHIGVTIGLDTPAHKADIDSIVYRGIIPRRGSVSAEHGIGLEKLKALPMQRSPAAMTLMRTLKNTLDPGNQLNPNKVLALPDVD